MTTLTPAIGSNQFLTKFDKKEKRKFTVKFTTKIKIATVIGLLASLYLNYYILRANYVVTCSAGGHFMSQLKCDELATNKVDSQELARQKMVTNNQDLFQ